jgi:ATP-binding protein involved in chromosome partitioning
MAPAVLPDGSVLDLFGSGGGAAVAARLSAEGEAVPLLGSVPLSAALRRAGDDGRPIVADGGDAAAEALEALATAIAAMRRDLPGRLLPVSV